MPNFYKRIFQIFSCGIKRSRAKNQSLNIFEEKTLKRGVITGLVLHNDGSIMSGYFSMQKLQPEHIKEAKFYSGNEIKDSLDIRLLVPKDKECHSSSFVEIESKKEQ